MEGFKKVVIWVIFFTQIYSSGFDWVPISMVSIGLHATRLQMFNGCLGNIQEHYDRGSLLHC